MSLERLGVDQNELNSALAAASSNEEKAEMVHSGDIVVDDMELEAVPNSGDTNAYLLVPAGGSNERESVEKNTIDGGNGRPDDNLQPHETADMLMVESNDAPLHVALLAVPVEQQEPVAAGEDTKHNNNASQHDDGRMDDEVSILTDKILEIPTELDTQEIVPVAVDETPQESVEKLEVAALNAGEGLDSENTISAEHETLADMISDAVLEVEKGLEEAQLANESANNAAAAESEATGVQETTLAAVEEAEYSKYQQDEEKQPAIESSSAMEEHKLPVIVSVPIDAIHTQHENSEEDVEHSLESEAVVEEANLEENEIKEDTKEQLVKNENTEEITAKPAESIEPAELVPVESAAVQPNKGDLEPHNEQIEKVSESEDLAEDAEHSQNAEQHIEGHEIINSESEVKREENLDETKSEEDEVNPMAESIEKEITAEIAGMIAEEKGELTQNEDNREDGKQEDAMKEDSQTEEDHKIVNDIQIAEEPQRAEVVDAADGDQIAEESHTTEEKQAVEETLAAEDNNTAQEVLHTIEESQAVEDIQTAEEAQTAEENIKQGEIDEANEAEELKRKVDKIQVDELKPVDTADEETIPVGEVADLAAPEEVAADEIREQELKPETILPVESKPEQVASVDSKQDEPVVEQTQPEEASVEENKQNDVEQQELGTDNQQQDVTSAELQDTSVIQADEKGEATLSENQQAVEEKLEEDSILAQAAAELEAENLEKLEQPEMINNEMSSEHQNLEQLSEQKPAREETQTSQMEEIQQQIEALMGEQQLESEEPQQQIVELEQEKLETENQQEVENLEQEQQVLLEESEKLAPEATFGQQQPIIEIQHSSDAETQPQLSQPLAGVPAQVPSNVVEESLNSGHIEPATSLLTTIVQPPQEHTYPQQQQPTPVEIENVEAPSTSTLVGVNNPPAAVAASSVAPINVMDSVLNYVNASFMQLNNNNKQQQQQATQTMKDDNDDDNDLNAQLRR
ncbi:trichohyalin-like, partial [Rhagoletis pomonella]|uniref:trichohyalin-like n=1 Tax=Rhagoletis pomonella TaxID=28610 RepID=UPI00177BBAD8